MRLFLPAALIVVLDQISKQIMWRRGESYDVIEGFFRITLLKNAGAAFGLFQGGRWFFVAASILAIGFIIYIARTLPPGQTFKRVLLAMIMGGAVGNLIDRLYAGEVIDFIEIGAGGHWFPVFNVADMGVSIGATLLLVTLLIESRKNSADDAPEPSSPAEGDTNPPPVP